MGPMRVASPPEAGGEPCGARGGTTSVAGYCEDRNADEAVILTGTNFGSPERRTCAASGALSRGSVGRRKLRSRYHAA